MKNVLLHLIQFLFDFFLAKAKKMEQVTNNPGLVHIFHKIIGYTGYSLIGQLQLLETWEFRNHYKAISDRVHLEWMMETNKRIKLVNKNWKALIEEQELSELAKLSKKVKEISTFHILLANTVKLCREDMVKFLHREFPQFWQLSTTKLIFDSTKAIIRLPKMKYPTIKKKLFSILTFFMSTDKENKFLTISFGICTATFYPPYEKKFIPSNPLAYALIDDCMELIKLFIKPLEMVKYPEQISYQNLAVINEYAALRGRIEILTIAARKLGDEYVDLAKKILENEPIFDFIDDEVVKFMKARIRGDEIPFTMAHNFMDRNVLEHYQNEVSEEKFEPDSDSYFFEDSENEDDIMYESDSDLDETNAETSTQHDTKLQQNEAMIEN